MSVLFSRPLAYSTLADLVHHVRQNLTLTDLSLAVQLFAKNIDDESLPSNIQTMSCKLLLNLVDCIRSKSEQENGNGRDILMRMLEVGCTKINWKVLFISIDIWLEKYWKCSLFPYLYQQVFVLKFHTIARYQLVSIFKKCKPQSEMGVVDPGAIPGVPATPTPSTTPAIPPPAPPTPVAVTPQPPATAFDRGGEKEDKQTFQVSDCRSLVKTLVCGVKTITWGITSCKAPGGEWGHKTKMENRSNFVHKWHLLQTYLYLIKSHMLDYFCLIKKHLEKCINGHVTVIS